MRRVPALRTLAWTAILSAVTWGPGRADEGHARLEALSRSIVAQNTLAQTSAPSGGGLFQGAAGARVKHGLWSLVVPGWSQYRSGHTHRAMLFAGAELGVWTSYGVFQLQGHRREDSYEEWAMQFAGVSGSDHDDAYWRAVALYASNEDYNESVRRDLRAGVAPDGPLYDGEDGWLWRSETRRQDYRVLRAQSQDAYDRASLTLLFAVLNRLVSFIDAIRTAPVARTEFSQPAPDAVSFGVGIAPSVDGPSTVLRLRTVF